MIPTGEGISASLTVSHKLDCAEALDVDSLQDSVV
jgi:hypothetical protein